MTSIKAAFQVTFWQRFGAYMRFFIYLILCAASGLASGKGSRELSLLHFNIKELTTEKLLDQNNEQVNAAAKIIRDNLTDIISINEIQFDLENIPTIGLPGYTNDLNNMTRLIGKVGVFDNPWFYSFEPANTGRYAKNINTKGEYLKSGSSKTPDYADHENFGIFPAQYSTGLASRYPIIQRVILKKLKWTDWNPEIPLSNYRLANKDKLSKNIPLFDKSFVDSVIQLGSKRIHVITLHTVPAFGFGHARSFNEVRNYDQLAFLDWYLRGRCEPKSISKVKRCKTPIRPLSKNSSFIATGDWNTDIHSNDMGAKVLQSMDSSSVIKLLKPTGDFLGFGKSAVTYLKSGHDVNDLKLRLDYVAVSDDIDLLSSKIVSPKAEYYQFGCESSQELASELIPKEKLPDFLYQIIKNKLNSNSEQLYCAVRVSKKFVASRKASDHFPLLLKLKVR